MTDWKLWYAFNCPISQYTGRKAAKQGITSHPAVRQGVYQNSVSRDNHLVQFDTVYIGSQRAISNLEKAVKRQFDWQIERDGRGYSEWISGLDVVDIESALDKIIDGYKFKVEKVDSKFLPLTTENLEAFIAHYHLENIK